MEQNKRFRLKLEIHTYELLATGLLCLLGCFIFKQFIPSFASYAVFISVFCIVAFIGYYVYERSCVKKQKKVCNIVMPMLISFIITQFLYLIIGEMITCNIKQNFVQWIFAWILFLSVIGSIIYLYCKVKSKKFTKNDAILLVIYWGFLLRLLYNQYTSVSVLSRQNDTKLFTNRGGHLGYIWQIWANGILSQEDPRTLWEFYQPPFYYLICGYFVRFNQLFFVPILEAVENIQAVSLFCVTGTLILTDRMMVSCKFSENVRLFAISGLSLLPYFTLLAGAVNNDSLLLFLCTAIMCVTLEWYLKPNIWKLILAAVLTGLVVMTKISGSLLAPPILILFGMRLIKDKKKRWIRLAEYLLFGIISLPIGLWWNVRNMIRFDMPFVYFCEASRESIQFIPNYTVWERLFDLTNQLNHVNIDLHNQSANVDHNIWISTIKTLTFSHGHEVILSPVAGFFGTVLFVCTFIFCILMVVFSIYAMIKRDDKRPIRWFLGITILMQLAFYLYFNFAHTFVHNMHARYMLPAFVAGMILFADGAFIAWKKLKWSVKIKSTIKYLLLVFLTIYAGSLMAYIIEVVVLMPQ